MVKVILRMMHVGYYDYNNGNGSHNNNSNQYKKIANSQLVHTTSFKSQATFMTKISLVTLDKLHEVTNDNELWMKEKVNKIHLHILISCICIDICD